MQFISTERKGPVVVYSWHHEEQNLFNTPFIKEILQSLEEAKLDERITGVVVTSSLEKYWSSGLYLDWIIQQGQKDIALLREFLEMLRWMLITMTSYPKPLVAAINGHCVAAGAIVAACMDFRLMREDKGFVRLPEVQIDIPFWPGMTEVFHSMMPRSSFRDLAYTGDRFSAIKAKQLGFIDEYCPQNELLDRSVKLAQKLGMANWKTYAAIKNDHMRNALKVMEEEDPEAIEEFIERMRSGQI